jgi:predicted ArsR family transcriptional regulator
MSSPTIESSDVAILDLLRRVDSIGVSELAELMSVTPTAVRQRLNRLMADGIIERTVHRKTDASRGRPSHGYSLTEKGRRQTGSNFADLATALWNEIRAITDLEVRRGLLGRLAKTMAAMYGENVQGDTTAERMAEIKRVFAERNVPFSVDRSGGLPVLTAEACPYPVLAEQDRAVCAMEKMMFSELLQDDVKLTACRLDGASCCTFETA